MEFHHIGMAVKSIDQYYNEILNPLFGFETISQRVTNLSQNARISFAEKSNSVRIELIEAIDDKSPTANIVGREQGGIYHLGFLSDHFSDEIGSLKMKGFRLLSNKEGIAFLTSPSFEIYELIDSSLGWRL